MKDKDLIYIGIISVLAYFLYRKNSKTEVAKPANPNANPVGNATNGGLNLPPNMDLPNLTPTPANGLPTEVALNSSNVQPLIKDNEPTQIFGNMILPNYGMNPTPSQVVAPTPVLSPVVSQTPVLSPVVAPIPETTVTPTTPYIGDVSTLPTPIYTGRSIISEPTTPVKSLQAEIMTESPIGVSEPKIADVASDIVVKCGSSFSIPNDDKEGSYTNFWYDGRDFYTQTTSPLIRTIAVKISADAYLEGCRKYQMFQMQYT